jgi:hypothetical protein
MNENELKGLAELLRELEETLLTLQATENRGLRRLLVRKIRQLFTEIERNPAAFGMLDNILSLINALTGKVTFSDAAESVEESHQLFQSG